MGKRTMVASEKLKLTEKKIKEKEDFNRRKR
jgi:hypothetical protein